ncbi:MAG: tRNA (adenosine(37)-N6)-threonylcarbamoyltransferase complex transferase subunit TsaD [Oscillospiraceae bacterium]|jgi:N6-L-threonylcarbamoyladenine synthase|nr:tRNA (adenosine(37)-N6)-threonylcarbamoyltransferase complex transferase subunit TsaD [Oscillospiraceae bacterium]
MFIIGIETSCDETSVSIVEDGKTVLSNITASQTKTHSAFGGVVPEIASRLHCEVILDLLEQALSEADITLEQSDAIAVTYTPGLIGALLVGVSFAKGLSIALNKPLIPVNHIAGHIAANYLADNTGQLKPPFLALVISGGHTQIMEVNSYTPYSIKEKNTECENSSYPLTVIGSTRDDAVGECFDKSARLIGLPYPGGVHVDSLAKQGNPYAYKFPKPKVSTNEFDFSFSGLKTAVINTVHNLNQKNEPINKADIAASLQRTICEILVEKMSLAIRKTGHKRLVLSGGVAANSGIRNAFGKMANDYSLELFMPPPNLCGDNAAMIACQGYYNFKSGIVADETLNAAASIY